MAASKVCLVSAIFSKSVPNENGVLSRPRRFCHHGFLLIGKDLAIQPCRDHACVTRHDNVGQKADDHGRDEKIADARQAEERHRLEQRVQDPRDENRQRKDDRPCNQELLIGLGMLLL